MISFTNFRNGGAHNAIYQSKNKLSHIIGAGIKTESRYGKSNRTCTCLQSWPDHRHHTFLYEKSHRPEPVGKSFLCFDTLYYASSLNPFSISSIVGRDPLNSSSRILFNWYSEIPIGAFTTLAAYWASTLSLVLHMSKSYRRLIFIGLHHTVNSGYICAELSHIPRVKVIYLHFYNYKAASGIIPCPQYGTPIQ